MINRRILLAERPVAEPTAANFRLETVPVPEAGEGKVLLRTLFLSLDPYMRGRMSDAPSYAKPVDVGAVMVGGTISRVETSRHPDFVPGDIVVAWSGWQDYAISNGAGLIKLPAGMDHPSYALGVLGMPGFTAYMGLLDIGKPRPGETLVVAAATGAVGSVVGQIAKLKGCKVIGIAGGKEKCDWAVNGLGFDACIDHHDPRLPDLLAAACPDGIDIYFENVGGKIFDAVLPLLNPSARIPVCGLISGYSSEDQPDGPDRTAALMRAVLTKRLTIRGFIIFDDYGDRYGEFQADMSVWFHEGRIKYRDDIVDGLENAPQAFMGLLKGRNFGKLVVRVAD